MRAFLHHRLTRVPAERIDRALVTGEYVTDDGSPLHLHSPFVPGLQVWFHRELPDEVPVPFDIEVLYQDERIVVVDKPHFLSTIPRGRHVMQSVVVKLRDRLGLPELSPAHRLDRATAGVLLLTTEQRWRGAYQNVFRDRGARKSYLAVAGLRHELSFPVTVRSHIVKDRGVLRAYEISGAPPNAETAIELLESAGPHGLYRLHPRTGRTHQLRVHLASLGLPIIGDRLYPAGADEPDDDPADFTDPLQLLAHTLEFVDPLDGSARRFVSRRSLNWASGGDRRA